MILLSIILLMLVVGIVRAPTNPSNDGGFLDDPTKTGPAKKDTGGGFLDGPGIGSEGDVSTDPKDKAEADKKASEQGEENARDGTPPTQPYGPIDIPEFSTIGMLAAGAAASFGYMYLRRKRK